MSGVSASGSASRWPVGGHQTYVLVDVAPAPVLARLHGLHDRVADRVRVRAGVPHRRGVAAADVPAGQAQPQVHPRGAEPQAFLAALRGARRHRADRATGAGRHIDGHDGRPSFAACSADSAWLQPIGAAPRRERRPPAGRVTSPVVEDQQGRHRLHREPLRQRRRLVDVDLDQLDLSGQFAGDLFQRRADHPAGPAPGRPQVDEHRDRGLLGDLGEVVVAGRRRSTAAAGGSCRTGAARRPPPAPGCACPQCGQVDDRRSCHGALAQSWPPGPVLVGDDQLAVLDVDPDRRAVRDVAAQQRPADRVSTSWAM